MNSCQQSIVNKKKIGGYTSLGSGTSGSIFAVYAVDEEHVYIGGGFLNAGGVTGANYITMWNGKTNTFTKLGNGTGPNTSVRAIYALDAEHVYIGGSFASVDGNVNIKYITMWNGTTNTFTKLGNGTGLNTNVRAIYALDAEHVYIGGTFTSVDGNTNIKYAIMYNGTTNTFTKIADSLLVGNIYAIYALDTEHVYIGGIYNSNQGGIYLWNGTTFSTIKILNYTVNAIYALDINHIYIGGNFTDVVIGNYVTVYDGSNNTFTKLGTGTELGANVTTIYALDETHVYMGGNFGFTADVRNITMWNGSSYTSLGGLQNYPNSIYALDETHVYIGGEFTSVKNPNSTVNLTNNKYITMWSG